MRHVDARRSYVLLHDNGVIHYPFTKFLTEKFDSPHSREAAAKAMRMLYRFTNAHNIELAYRALEGRGLTFDEIRKLAALAYRPAKEIELLSDQKVRLITSAKAEIEPSKLPKAVQPNTAKKRLVTIAEYLSFYFEVFLNPHIRQSSLRAELLQEYKRAKEQLLAEIRGTKQNHHLTYRSLPAEKFLALIRKVVLNPEEVFQTASGKPSETLWRDRAMVLLACEGLRSGAIGNIARADVLQTGHLMVVDNRRRRPGRPTTNIPVLKLGDTVRVNSASETLLELYPFTYDAIKDYIKHERQKILGKYLRNRSAGFLFITSTGEPIKDRSTIKKMFTEAGNRLRDLGMLNVSDDPYFPKKKVYDFYGYVLRHSSADFYLRVKGISDETIKSMKSRFGWTTHSNQWERYANRIMAEHSSVNLNDFYEQLLDELALNNKERT